MVDFYIQSRGTVGINMSANADLITLETYVHQGKKITTSFSYMGQNMNKNVIFLLFRRPWGTFNDNTGPVLLSRYPLTHSSNIGYQNFRAARPHHRISFKFYMRVDTPLRFAAIEIWYSPSTRTTAFAAKRHLYPQNLQMQYLHK